MKYSICNIQLLPKAADLRKKAFDEFRLNMLIVLLQLLSRKNATKSWLTSSSFLIPSFPGPRVFSTQWFIVWPWKWKRDDQKEQRGRTIRKVMGFILFYFERYLFRGAQLGEAGLNGALVKRKKNAKDSNTNHRWPRRSMCQMNIYSSLVDSTYNCKTQQNATLTRQERQGYCSVRPGLPRRGKSGVMWLVEVVFR